MHHGKPPCGVQSRTLQLLVVKLAMMKHLFLGQGTWTASKSYEEILSVAQMFGKLVPTSACVPPFFPQAVVQQLHQCTDHPAEELLLSVHQRS